MTTDLPTLSLAVRGKAAPRIVVLGALGRSNAEMSILGVQPDAHLLTVDDQGWRLEARARDVFGAYPRALWRGHCDLTTVAARSYVGKADLLVITAAIDRDGALREMGPWLPVMRPGGYVWVDGGEQYADSLGRTIVAAGRLLLGPAAADGAWIGKVPRNG